MYCGLPIALRVNEGNMYRERHRRRGRKTVLDVKEVESSVDRSRRPSGRSFGVSSYDMFGAHNVSS